MASYSWKASASGAWTDGSKWSPFGGPTLDAVDDSGSKYSSDTATFATGSAKRYAVSGVADAQNVVVTGDHVRFDNLQLSNDFDGVDMTVSGGAAIVIGRSSVVNLAGDFYSANDGDLNVTDAQVTVKGTVENGFGQIGGQLDIAGGTVSFINEHDLPSGGYVSGDVDVTRGGILNATFESVSGNISISGQGSIWTTHAVFYEPEVTGTIEGSNGATLAGAVTNQGTIEAAKGIFHVTATVSNLLDAPTPGGMFQIDKGATLDLGGTSDNDVTFQHNATLMLEKSVGETGFLRSFSTNDRIDVAQQSVTSFAVLQQSNATILTAFSGAAVAETLTFAGSYTAANFMTQTDQNGGTLIDFVPNHGAGATPFPKLA